MGLLAQYSKAQGKSSAVKGHLYAFTFPCCVRLCASWKFWPVKRPGRLEKLLSMFLSQTLFAHI